MFLYPTKSCPSLVTCSWGNSPSSRDVSGRVDLAGRMQREPRVTLGTPASWSVGTLLRPDAHCSSTNTSYNVRCQVLIS